MSTKFMIRRKQIQWLFVSSLFFWTFEAFALDGSLHKVETRGVVKSESRSFLFGRNSAALRAPSSAADVSFPSSRQNRTKAVESNQFSVLPSRIDLHYPRFQPSFRFTEALRQQESLSPSFKNHPLYVPAQMELFRFN